MGGIEGGRCDGITDIGGRVGGAEGRAPTMLGLGVTVGGPREGGGARTPSSFISLERRACRK